MKIEFDGSNFIECAMVGEDKVAVILSARDGQAKNKSIINSVEVTLEEFRQLVSDIPLK
jgi:hypothetical protein